MTVFYWENRNDRQHRYIFCDKGVRLQQILYKLMMKNKIGIKDRAVRVADSPAFLHPHCWTTTTVAYKTRDRLNECTSNLYCLFYFAFPGRNVAIKQITRQSSMLNFSNAFSWKAVDGNNSPRDVDKSCAKTDKDLVPEWRLTYNMLFIIYNIIIYNRDGTFEFSLVCYFILSIITF